MTYAVEFKDGADWISWLINGKSETPHLSSADTRAHNLFKDGKTVRVLSVGKSPEEASVLYTLAPETHRVDEHGQVRPIPSDMLSVPAGAKPTDAGKRRAGVIDMTPTWSAVLPILILAFTNGTDEAQKIAIEELKTMAKAADAWNASVK